MNKELSELISEAKHRRQVLASEQVDYSSMSDEALIQAWYEADDTTDLDMDELLAELAARDMMLDEEGEVYKIIDGEEVYFEETFIEAMKKVIRAGKVVKIKIKTKKKRRMSPKQRAALAKASKKAAHSGAAKKARAKSMKKRKSAGL